MKDLARRVSSRISVQEVLIGNQCPLSIIAGPCIMESEKHLWTVARSLKAISDDLNLGMIFKCSYDKANRSSHHSYRGPGMEKGLEMLLEIKKKFKFPILTDVHLPQNAERAAEVADILQIPAFLCRQTDLITACARTGRVINIKKGQFVSPGEMNQIIEKVLASGNHKIMLTERGTFFGYNNLVVDLRGIEIMKKTGVPVVFDATHSVQLPGERGTSSGGQREFVGPLARGAVALKIAALFMEVHPDPDRALSDGPNSLQLSKVKGLLSSLLAIDKVVKKRGG